MKRREAIALYLGLVVAVCVAVGLGAALVPAWVIAVAAAIALLGGGLLLWRPWAAANDAHRWRDAMPCYLSIQDRDLRIIEVNDYFRRDLGPGLGEHCFAAYKRRTSPCPDCPVLKTFADGRVHSSEETVITKGGEVASVVVTSTPFATSHGRVTAVMEMSTNITEVKSLRHELAQSRDELRRLFDIVPCYITLQDREFRIIDSNRLFREDFGDSTGQRCYRAYKGRDELCSDCPVAKTFQDGQVHSGEETVVTRDGRRLEMIVYSMAVRDEAGEIETVMEVSTNITRVKELQRQLALVGLAVTGMAHRIKNVMMGLEGGIFVVNTALADRDDAGVQRGWQMVERNAAKISRIARDLLYCSKEREPQLVADVSPRAIAQEVCDSFRSRMQQEKIELRLELGEEDDRGWYDPEGLHNLVSNLLTNALDACRFDAGEGKQHAVTLRCRRQANGAAVIEVSDNGAGISQEDSARLFDGFFSTKGSEGTGLGLLVVQKVAQEHGGSVTFDSREGAGTTFRVVLGPCAAPAACEH